MNKLVSIFFSHCKILYYLTFGALKLFQEDPKKKGNVFFVLLDLWYYKIRAWLFEFFKGYLFCFEGEKKKVFDMTRFSSFLFILWCSLWYVWILWRIEAFKCLLALKWMWWTFTMTFGLEWFFFFLFSLHGLCFLVIRFCFIQNLNLGIFFEKQKEKWNLFFILLDIFNFMKAWS
jgi:hypothetical protein